ncbi:MAG: DUF11 domain-containing protein, partial [Desulfotomaculaceae bacterium]
MVSNTNTLYPEAYPYINPGVHKVFLNEGERLYLGSSAQGMLVAGSDANGYGAIRVFKPSSVVLREIAADNTGYLGLKDATPDYYSGPSTTDGRIQNRFEELLGPKIGAGAGYEPFSFTADETGIYEVWFYAPQTGLGAAETSSNAVGQGTVDVANNPQWSQNTSGRTITAWDVTVTDAAGNIKPGRTYLNVFNGAATTSVATAQFYGNFCIVTKDGFPYLVEGNGLAGLFYTFFVNNRGFTTEGNGGGLRTYKSQMPAGGGTPYNIKNPNQDDDPLNTTHKLFYGQPNADLPSEADYNGGSTWLKLQNPPDPEAENIKFVGVEGSDGYGGSKGAYIEFNANVAGTYRITIPGGTGPAPDNIEYYERVLTGGSVVGFNQVYCDGRTGTQADPTVPAILLPPGATVGTITVQLTGAEVHFPYLDMEANANGVKVIQLDKNTYAYPDLIANPEKDLVWWDDTDENGNSIGNTGGTAPNPLVVPYNGLGQHSSTNGHAYGGSGSSGFGNQRGIDTYSFVPGPMSNLTGVVVEIKEADLSVESFTADKPSGETVSVGDSYTYTVTVKNSGPYAIQTGTTIVGDPGNEVTMINKPARFNLYVPAGIEVDLTDPNYGWTSPNGVTSEERAEYGAAPFSFAADPNGGGVYTVYLNMPIDGVATFTLPVNVVSGVKQTDDGLIHAYATILRPTDFSDPDATNPDYINIIEPTDPFEEIFWEETGSEIPPDVTTISRDEKIFTEPGNYKADASGALQRESNNILRISQPFMAADLEIQKSGVQSDPGDGTATFTLTVTNHGPSKGTNIVVTDELSSRYAFIANSGVASQGTAIYDPITKIITWDVGDLDVDESATFIFATINTGSANAENSADVEGDEHDPTPGDNEEEIIPESPTLSLTKTVTNVSVDKGASTTIADAGDEITYEFIVTNTGGLTLTDIEVLDPLLGGALDLSGVTWPGATGVLTTGQSITVEAVYTITAGDVAAVKVDNKAYARGKPTGLPMTSSLLAETSTSLAAPSMSFTKDVDNVTVANGVSNTAIDAGD